MAFFTFDSLHRGKKCAVIGCHGAGASIAHSLAHSGLVEALVLIDRDRRLADGQAADICASLPLYTDTDVWAGDYSDVCDCALIVLAIGTSPIYESAHADLALLNLPLVRVAIA